ncbi:MULTISPECIES: hypothetical protein [unclassified Microcoleus]|uniref:hypothetical protein n=1 Tax=unclassified Microcoleus TaxID=2642155 RepID=UPI002FD442DA
MAVITQEQATQTTQELTAKPRIQSRVVQAFVEPGVYVEFTVREDFYNFFEVVPVLPQSADKAISKYKPPSTATTPRPPSNKGNGVTYRNKSRKLAGKKIKFPVKGADAPPVNSKNAAKKKKTMTIRVPSIMSAAAIAIWVNTAFSSATKRPSSFTLESGTEIGIDPNFTDPTQLKPMSSIKGKSEVTA